MNKKIHLNKKAISWIWLWLGTLFISFSAQAQTYDPYAVQVINNLIANNGLTATPDAPETWTFATWNDENPKQLIELDFISITYIFLHGDASFAGLTTLQKLLISDSRISLLDLTNCTQLQKLDCYACVNLTKLDLTNCTQLEYLKCYECELTQLSVTNCIQLKSIDCTDNHLTELNVANCTQLQRLWCELNGLTKLVLTNCTQLYDLGCSLNCLTELDLTNCTQLQNLWCYCNSLTELNLTNCMHLKSLSCYHNCLTKLSLGVDNLSLFLGLDQKVSLTLHENEAGEYTHSILLNNPAFGNNAISYWDNILKSVDTTVTSTIFSVQTGKAGYELSGTMNFNYTKVGINEQDKVQLQVYPNPTTGQLTINNEQLTINNVEIFDIYGKKHHLITSSSNHLINISHLPAGVYFVKITTDTGIQTQKIIKL